MQQLQHFDIVMVILQQGSLYHLQLRNGKGQSGALGLVGCFGGEIENGETPQEAACRELAEESTVELSPESIRQVGEVNVVSEKYGKPATVHCHVYHARINDEVKVAAREGELVTASLTELIARTDLSPALTAAIQLLEKET